MPAYSDSLGHFDFVLTCTHLVGFITVCLNGYFFNTFMNGLGWPSKDEIEKIPAINLRGKQLHGLAMFLCFIFFQGEALLAHRVYRYSSSSTTKTIHAIFHLFSILLGSTGLASMVLSIEYSKTDHFSNLHSWLGAGFLLVYTGQLSFGLVTFLFPCATEAYRTRMMPMHRAVGISCMIVACIQCCLGYNQLVHNRVACFKSLSCANRIEYVGAVSMLFNILYTLMVLAVVTPKPWRREKTFDELK